MENGADELGIEDVDRKLDVAHRFRLVDVVLECALDDGIGVLTADEGADIGLLPEEGVGHVLQVVDAALDMALQVSVHVDDRFLDFTGIELVSAANLIEKFGNFLRRVAREGFHFLLVDEVTNLLHHFILSRHHVTIEHVLVVLVHVVVELLFKTAHDIHAFEDFLGQFGTKVMKYFICFFFKKLIDFFLLVTIFLGK